MKAYDVWVDNSDKGSGIVWANNRNEAKVKAQCTYSCEDERYIEIHARRLPKLDGMEDCNPKDNPWLDDNVRKILVEEYGWSCFEPNIEDCKVCCVKNSCSNRMERD